MQIKDGESKIEKVMRVLNEKFCETVVKRIICVILLSFEIDKHSIAEKLKMSLKSVKKYEKMLNAGLTSEIITIKGNSRKSELEDYKARVKK